MADEHQHPPLPADGEEANNHPNEDVEQAQAPAGLQVVVTPWFDIDIPDGDHYYDHWPPAYRTNDSVIGWWRRRCDNDGRKGHTVRGCDQEPFEMRCIYCGAKNDHTVQTCRKRLFMEEFLAKRKAAAAEQPKAAEEEDWDAELAAPQAGASENNTHRMTEAEIIRELDTVIRGHGNEDQMSSTEGTVPPNATVPTQPTRPTLEEYERRLRTLTGALVQIGSLLSDVICVLNPPN